MSTLRLALVAALTAPCLLPTQSHAQLAVVCANCTQEQTAQINNAAVAASWTTQLLRMTLQINQQINTFHALSGATNVNAMVGILNQANNFNQMNQFGNVPQQLMGTSGGAGAGFQAANGNMLPVGNVMPLMAANAAVFNQRAGSLATVQGISTALLANSNVILTGLRALQQLIDGQPTSQLMSGMNARMTAYQGNINSQQYQLQQMQVFASAQEKVFEQKQQQAAYCSDYAWANATQSLTGAGLNLGAANCGGLANAVPAVPGTALPVPPVPPATTQPATALPVPPAPEVPAPPPVQTAAATPADNEGFDTPVAQ